MFKTLMLLSQPAEHLDHRLAGSAGRCLFNPVTV